MVMGFSGWMDGGEVSTGSVKRLIKTLGAEKIAEISPEPLYIYIKAVVWPTGHTDMAASVAVKDTRQNKPVSI
jgi:hypothetical protein